MPTYSQRPPAPLPLYFVVPPFPVVWYSPSSRSHVHSPRNPVAPVPRTRSPAIAAAGTPFPPKRVQHWPPRPSRSASPSPTTVPRTPQLRNVPLPDVSDGYGVIGERAYYPYVLQQRPTGSHIPPSLTAHPSVDPFLALPHHPNTRSSIVWDLMHPPSTAVLHHPSLTHDALGRRVAARASRREGGQPLQSLVLVFPLLPMEIVIVPSRTPFPGAAGYVSLWDVLEGLYRGLRAPVEPQELRKLTESERETLLAAAEARRRVVPEREDASRQGGTLRKIDYLSRRRWFLGIRPALGYELPRGRKLGDVFVVEVGTAPG